MLKNYGVATWVDAYDVTYLIAELFLVLLYITANIRDMYCVMRLLVTVWLLIYSSAIFLKSIAVKMTVEGHARVLVIAQNWQNPWYGVHFCIAK